MRFLVLLVPLVAFSSSVGAQDSKCPARKELTDKPLLTGEVIDGSRGLSFVWKSSAGVGGNSWWTVQHTLCNNGSDPLVITWKKAALRAWASTPLPPTFDLVNSYSVGPNAPSSDSDSPIAYGLRNGTSAAAQTYQPSETETKTGSLSSTMIGTFARESTFGSVVKREGQIQLEIVFDVRRTADGYTFGAYPKYDPANNLFLAVSSSQNKAMTDAFNKAGYKSVLVPAQKLGLEDEHEYVFVTSFSKEIFASIPGPANRVEIARVALINGQAGPIMQGNVSVFRP